MLHRSVPCMRAFTQATERWPDLTKGNETTYNSNMNTVLVYKSIKAYGQEAISLKGRSTIAINSKH